MEEKVKYTTTPPAVSSLRRFEIHLVVNTASGGKTITDQGHNILFHGEWLVIRGAVDKFYQGTTDAEIKEENKRGYEEELARWAARDQILATNRKKESKTGYIYMVRAIGTDLYKIGVTAESVNRRIKGIQTSCPHKLELVCSVLADDYIRRESELHALLKDKRTSGEWFSLSWAEAVWLMGAIDLNSKDMEEDDDEY